MIACGIAPVFLASLPAAITILGGLRGIGVTALGVLAALICFEHLFRDWAKLPFACSYLPDKVRRGCWFSNPRWRSSISLRFRECCWRRPANWRHSWRCLPGWRSSGGDPVAKLKLPPQPLGGVSISHGT